MNEVPPKVANAFHERPAGGVKVSGFGIGTAILGKLSGMERKAWTTDNPVSAIHLIQFGKWRRGLITKILRLAGILIAACLVACGSTPSATHNFELSEPGSPSELQERWIMVSSDPPTFHPRDLADNARTDANHGRWITSTNPPAKWFLPKGGVGDRSEAQLLEEAFAMRIAVKRARPGQAGELAMNSVGSGIVLAMGSVSHYGTWVNEALDDMWTDPDLGTTYTLLSEIYGARGNTDKARKYASKANMELPGTWAARNGETNKIDQYPYGEYWRAELDEKIFFVERPRAFQFPASSDKLPPASRPLPYSRVRDSSGEWLTVYSYENDTKVKALARTWRLEYLPDPEGEKPFEKVKFFARNIATDETVSLGKADLVPVKVNADFREEVAKLTREGLSSKQIADFHNMSLDRVELIQQQKNVDLDLLRKMESHLDD